MADLINVNGTITPAERAVVPVLDHGVLYGDSVYETIRTYRGKPFLLERHLERLATSCRLIRLVPPAMAEVGREVMRTIQEAGNPESYVRIMITRGAGPIGYDAGLCPRPGMIVIVMPLKEIPAESYEKGVKLTIAGRRRNPVESLSPEIKSCNLLNNILAHMEAQDAGSAEAVLFNTRGFLAEGTHSNVFFVARGVVKTPELSCGLLSGITREVVLEAARDGGVPCEEGAYTREEFVAADEIFVTSTLQEVMPVSVLDGRPVGSGLPGPVTKRVHALFRQRMAGRSTGS